MIMAFCMISMDLIKKTYNKYGRNIYGFDEYGLNKNHYDMYGFDEEGLNKDGLNKFGYKKNQVKA